MTTAGATVASIAAIVVIARAIAASAAAVRVQPLRVPVRRRPRAPRQ